MRILLHQLLLMQVTSDGVPVIFHDPYIVHGSLCTPKRSLVSELTLAEVRQITHFFRWFKDSKTLARLPCDFAWHCEHEDMPAPTLEELFNQLPEVLLCTYSQRCLLFDEQHVCEVQRVCAALVLWLAPSWANCTLAGY
jgi:hypothetical protein